ncbi:MAG TPA: hypothetical protein VMT76_05355 [Puia sp.]|nr:hypothetical protein [Puia sp.]
MRKLAIIHFQPVELYPPVQNLLNYLGKAENNYLIEVFTTAAVQHISKFQCETQRVKIRRLGKSGIKNPLLRYLSYFNFFFFSLIYLIKIKPQRILYFETLSSYPVYLYKQYFNTATEILIHYHEYSSPKEITEGMKLNKFFHEGERHLYPHALWISHTNDYRMKLFTDDEASTVIGNPHILPNYPPKNWQVSTVRSAGTPLKIILAGVVGLETMYIREFSEWVLHQEGNVIWDIYTFVADNKTKFFLDSLNTRFINLKNAVEYKDLPVVLRNYDIGVILYKGHIPNYIYNAPNKLFEYYVNGLDVWFPEQMIGAHRFITANSFPKVIPIKFENISAISLKTLTDKSNLKFLIHDYSCESVLNKLNETLLN